MKRLPLALAAVAVLAVSGAAAAHGVEADVERRGSEIAVRARYEGGRPLAGARFEVTSPARPERAWAEGRTDREGWLAFTPDAPGTWNVRVADASGHGRLVSVEVAQPPPIDRAPPPPASAPSSWAPGRFARTAGGVAVVALVFGLLYAAGRLRRAAGR